MRLSQLTVAVAAAILACAMPFALASVDARGDLPVIAGGKTDRVPTATCVDQDWPYVSGPCLDGRAPVRVISITAGSATVLVR